MYSLLHYHVYASYHFDLQFHINFLFVFKHTLTSVKSFLGLFNTYFVNLVQIILIIIRVQNSGASLAAHTFFVSFCRISSTALLTMLLFPFCLLICPLGTYLLPQSLVGLILSYLVPNYPRILHSSEECLGPWMRQVFDFPIGLSTCRFLRFPELSPLSGRVHYEAGSPLLCLM